MSSLRTVITLLAALLLCAWSAPAGAELTALARIDRDESRIADAGEGAEIVLALTQPVPWRIFTLDDPRRLVLDFSEVDWGAGLGERSRHVTAVRTGSFQAGWSRMVLDLAAPLGVESAEMVTDTADGRAVLTIRLAPATAEDFAASAGSLPDARFRVTRREPDTSGAAPALDGAGLLRVVIDAGHGGIDPGAESEGLTEAELMLTFARELREVLLRSDGFQVSMIRDEDVFVPLETRITMARAAGADVLLSLHADALPDDAGEASGATVYTLSKEASDLASQRLAERHDQSDLLAGVDLSGQSDEIAVVLMDLARQDTAPRADALADALVAAMSAELGKLNSRPRRRAAFSVLKAADIPSVLIELGFLSSEKDRKKLTDPVWRAIAAEAIRDGLRRWAEEDARRAALLRK